MSDLRRPLAGLGDDELGAELRALAGWLDAAPGRLPASSQDPARRARLRIEAGEGASRRWPFGGWGIRDGGVRKRPVRRSFVLALVALAVVAAIVGAIGLGVPGIRIIFTGGETPSPGASTVPTTPAASASPQAPGPPGSGFDLGVTVTAEEASRLSGFEVLAPTDPAIGPPDAIWYRDHRVTLVWAARPGLPDLQATGPSTGVGLLVTEFRGRTDRDLFRKMLTPQTQLTPITVAGAGGYWISGVPHDFFYVDERGEVVVDSRRIVGDTLLWTRGDMTFRLETSLGRDAAIRSAETVE